MLGLSVLLDDLCYSLLLMSYAAHTRANLAQTLSLELADLCDSRNLMSYTEYSG